MRMNKKLITAKQLAKELSVGVETIETWGRTGRIPRIRISRKIIRYDRDAVLIALKRMAITVSQTTKIIAELKRRQQQKGNGTDLQGASVV